MLNKSVMGEKFKDEIQEIIDRCDVCIGAAAGETGVLSVMLRSLSAILQSGLVLGAIVATFLNLVLPRTDQAGRL